MVEKRNIEELKKHREAVINGIKNNPYYTKNEKLKMIQTIKENWQKQDAKLEKGK